MCNDYRLLTDAATLYADFSEIKIKIRFSERGACGPSRNRAGLTKQACHAKETDGPISRAVRLSLLSSGGVQAQ
jgi:hypothetical protein